MANADIRQLEMDGRVFYPQTDIHGLVNNGVYAIDDEPTQGSSNLVTSDSVYSVKSETLEENRQMVNSIMEDYAPVEIHGDVTNSADEEDLTSVNVEGTDVLKFKDKVYNPLVYSGLGKKNLRKNMVSGVNTLTQEMMSDANTIYFILYDFILGEDITVPDNCILKFEGGSINGNAHKLLNLKKVIANTKCFSDIVFSTNGKSTLNVHSDWFIGEDKKSDEDNHIDCTTEMQELMECGSLNIILDNGLYYVSDTIDVKIGINIIGFSAGNRTENMSYNPENPYKNDTLIFTDRELPILRFYGPELILRSPGTISGFAISNININPTDKNTPLVKYEIDSDTSIWGLTFDCFLLGNLSNGSVSPNYVGILFEFDVNGGSATGYLTSSVFRGCFDRLYKAVELKKIGSSGWATALDFYSKVINCDQFVVCDRTMNAFGFTIKPKVAQFNVRFDINNELPWCYILGNGNLDVDIFSGDFLDVTIENGEVIGTSNKYLLETNGSWVVSEKLMPYIKHKNGSRVSHFPTYSVPYNYNNDLLARYNDGLMTIDYIKVLKDGVDVGTDADRSLVLSKILNYVDFVFEPTSAASQNSGIEVSFNFVIAQFKKVLNNIFYVRESVNYYKYKNKSVSIKYYNSSNVLLFEQSSSCDNGQNVELTSLPKEELLPTNTNYVKVIFRADSITASNYPASVTFIKVPAFGISGDFSYNTLNSPYTQSIELFPTKDVNNNYNLYYLPQTGIQRDLIINNISVYKYLFSISIPVNNTTVPLPCSVDIDIIAPYNTKQNVSISINSLNNTVDVKIAGRTSTLNINFALYKNEFSNGMCVIDAYVSSTIYKAFFCITNALTRKNGSKVGNVFVKSGIQDKNDVSDATVKYSTVSSGYVKGEYPSKGDQFFDTSIGQPIYWDGSTWVDALGNCPDPSPRVVLPKNMVSGVNTLTQAMINTANKIYIVQYDFTLGEDITIPANCVLEFEGGSISANGERKEVITLNGSKINAYGKVFTGIKFLNEEGVYLRTSWWGFGNNMQNASSMLGNIINAAKTKGVVVVDSDIYIETPIQINNMLEAVIVGENNGKIISSYSPNSGESLITFNSEACIIKNINFVWNIPNVYTGLDGSNSLLKCDTRFDNYADLDVTITDCLFSANINVKLLKLYGRGVRLENNTFYCSEENKSKGSLIRFEAKMPNNETDVFYKPADAGRGITIIRNRIHAAINKYAFDFENSDYPNFTYVNTQILDNHSDGGACCIISGANHRGLIISNNVFMNYTTGSFYEFNYFAGNIDGLLFSNNIIGSSKDSDKAIGETYFNNSADGSKVIKNIKFSDNIFDAKQMAVVCMFIGKALSTLPSISNIEISRNMFSENCFIGGSGGSKILMTSSNNSIETVKITDNTCKTSGLIGAAIGKDNSSDASSANKILINNNFGVSTPIYDEENFNTRFNPTHVVKENNF